MTCFVVYTYLGAGTMTQVAHPAVSAGLTLTYKANGDSAGWDRFGRPRKGRKVERPLFLFSPNASELARGGARDLFT